MSRRSVERDNRTTKIPFHSKKKKNLAQQRGWTTSYRSRGGQNSKCTSVRRVLCLMLPQKLRFPEGGRGKRRLCTLGLKYNYSSREAHKIQICRGRCSYSHWQWGLNVFMNTKFDRIIPLTKKRVLTLRCKLNFDVSVFTPKTIFFLFFVNLTLPVLRITKKTKRAINRYKIRLYVRWGVRFFFFSLHLSYF